MTKSYQTPLRRARGGGSAHDGVEHFIAQRISAVASLPLTVFIMVLAVVLAGKDHAAAKAIVGQPLVAVGLVATAVVFIRHMKLGMQVIIEDYVHGRFSKPALLLVNALFCGLVFIIAVMAIGKIAFGA